VPSRTTRSSRSWTRSGWVRYSKPATRIGTETRSKKHEGTRRADRNNKKADILSRATRMMSFRYSRSRGGTGLFTDVGLPERSSCDKGAGGPGSPLDSRSLTKRPLQGFGTTPLKPASASGGRPTPPAWRRPLRPFRGYERRGRRRPGSDGCPRCLAGRATIQSVLDLSAEHAVGGLRQQGKCRAGAVVWYGRQTPPDHAPASVPSRTPFG